MTNRPSKTILIDMDGILADILTPWVETYNLRYGDNITPSHVLDWDCSKAMRMASREDVKAIIKEPGFFAGLLPYPGSRNAVRALKSAGHEVLVCTTPAGPDSAKEKIEWCEKWLGLRNDHVITIRDKHRVEADVLIDDKPNNIRAWKAKGRVAFSIAHPYNRSIAYLCDVYAEGVTDTRKAWNTIVSALC